MNYWTGYCTLQSLGVPQPQAKGPPGPGGCNNLCNSSLEGLLCFISPLFQVKIRILPIQTRILHIILHRKNIFTRSLVFARTYPPPDCSNGFSYTAHSPNIVMLRTGSKVRHGECKVLTVRTVRTLHCIFGYSNAKK